MYVGNRISLNTTFCVIDTGKSHSEVVEADHEDKDDKMHVTNKDANQSSSESIFIFTAPFEVLKCAAHVT